MCKIFTLKEIWGVGFSEQAVSRYRKVVEEVTQGMGPWWEYPTNKRKHTLHIIYNKPEDGEASVSLILPESAATSIDSGVALSITYNSDPQRHDARIFVRMEKMGEMTFVVTA